MPLNLCYIKGFDLLNQTGACPPERNALNEIYILAKGQEWTDSDGWVNEHISHCSWKGVTCDPKNSTIKLELPNNGLSGKLSRKENNSKNLTKMLTNVNKCH